MKVLRVDEHSLEALASRNGVHRVTLAGRGDRAVVVEGIPAPFGIAGAWQLALGGEGFSRTEPGAPSNASAPHKRDLAHLGSWTDDPATRHFSGTGRYTKTFDLPAEYVREDLKLELRLGDVGNIADAELNGTRAGVIWMRGQALDVTRLVKGGRNHLTVDVINTLINRVAGWKTVPELPGPLKQLYGHGIDDESPQARALFGFEPLPRSGLLGPVTITPLKRVRVDLSGSTANGGS